MRYVRFALVDGGVAKIVPAIVLAGHWSWALVADEPDLIRQALLALSVDVRPRGLQKTLSVGESWLPMGLCPFAFGGASRLRDFKPVTFNGAIVALMLRGKEYGW